uniref:Uncharacterized protein n=1 Tax=Arundo donax TaxID=35708 RepID=A0A0A9BVY0_ARUDO
MASAISAERSRQSATAGESSALACGSLEWAHPIGGQVR